MWAYPQPAVKMLRVLALTVVLVPRRGHATAVARASPTLVGRAFEERAIALLGTAGLDLRGTGGAFDGGIDFRGFLAVPGAAAAAPRVPVIGQCKAEVRKCGARYLRDFEAVLAREPQCLGVYVTLAGYSVHAQRHFLSSAFPLLLVRVTDRIETLQANASARLLLPGLTIGAHVPLDAEHERRPRLLFIREAARP
jgi:hypothetical protein